MPCCYVSLAKKADTVLEKRRKANCPFFLTHPHSLTPPPAKKNKTKHKRKQKKTKRNETKRNETKQNKTKRNKNKTKHKEKQIKS